jgi:hypothetical protein
MRAVSLSIRLSVALFLGCLLCFPEEVQGQEETTVNHFLSGYLFEMYKDNKPANTYLVMTLSGRQLGETGTDVQCMVANLKANALERAYRCELRHYSTGAGTITNASIGVESVAFDLHVGGSDADKKLRITCRLDGTSGRYTVKASGTWSDQTHTEFTRVKWKQLESIDMEYPKLLPALY